MKILIVGASSGIGRELVKKLVYKGDAVWAVARRRSLLKQLGKELSNRTSFSYSVGDITKKDIWKDLIIAMRVKKFRPETVIFTAAVYENDLAGEWDFKQTKNMVETNFTSILRGVRELLPYFGKKGRFIAISSSSAFRGNAKEGVGYASSKAALSVAFESLYQKYYSSGIIFTTIFFGPVNTSMSRMKVFLPILQISVDKAVDCIIKAIQEKKGFYYCPGWLFAFLRLNNFLLSREFSSKVFSFFERIYNK